MALLALVTSTACQRQDDGGARATATATATAQDAAKIAESAPIPGVNDLPIVDVCDDDCRATRRAKQLELASALLRQVLKQRGSKNVAFSPLAMVSPDDAALVPKSPVLLSHTIRRYPCRFVGIDGTSSQHALFYVGSTVPRATLTSSAGAYQVLVLPLRESTNQLLAVIPPLVTAKRIERSLDVALLQRILDPQPSGEAALGFAEPSNASNHSLPALIAELNEEHRAGVKQPPPGGLHFELVGGGATTGFYRARSPNQVARPTWFFLRNAEGDLLVVSALNTAPAE